MKLFASTIFKFFGLLKSKKVKTQEKINDHIEIERAFMMDERFCVLKLPKNVTKVMTYQDITNIYPEFSKLRYRIEGRPGNKIFYSTEKIVIGNGAVREIEKTISEKDVLNILNMPGTISLKKKRFYGVIDGYTFCIDLIGEYENSFYRVEIEKLSTPENYNQDNSDLFAYKLPEWLNKYVQKEVTGEKEYSNYNLALKLKNQTNYD